MKDLLVTGGRGFIGSHFVSAALKKGYKIIDYDKMTYAASEELPWDKHENYKLVKKDIVELDHLPHCDAIINFAAESHVDNSIRSSDVFTRSNIIGVHNLLELVRGKSEFDRPLFFQISTDEVYGDRQEGLFTEQDKLTPSNPYAATKAAAEMLVLSYHRTYKLDYLITRTSNNYGPRQYREKLIPRCLRCIEDGKKIPLHGDGSYVRDWTYVKDNVNGLLLLLEKKMKNDVYNIGAENFMTNLEVARTILQWKRRERREKEFIQFVENRKGQDVRYAVDSTKIRKLGWKPKYDNGLYQWK